MKRSVDQLKSRIPHSIDDCFKLYGMGHKTLAYYKQPICIQKAMKYLAKHCSYVLRKQTNTNRIFTAIVYDFFGGVDRLQQFVQNWENYEKQNFLSNESNVNPPQQYINRVRDTVGEDLSENLNTSTYTNVS